MELKLVNKLIEDIFQGMGPEEEVERGREQWNARVDKERQMMAEFKEKLPEFVARLQRHFPDTYVDGQERLVRWHNDLSHASITIVVNGVKMTFEFDENLILFTIYTSSFEAFMRTSAYNAIHMTSIGSTQNLVHEVERVLRSSSGK
jgi:hypothetical protein